jgi:hypothetical protein
MKNVLICNTEFYARKYFCDLSLMTPFGLVSCLSHFGFAVCWPVYSTVC